ncbi:hypothetical protein PR048_011451 [Dryococelus australis]|uniref:Uncharacterized protein n=1 Tax=Dryococelus australis TaxID=614101 RepID=A0ABQ9HLL0_9NEOP|nr:hypothetical protein PR048_011451 [Dryococelus australis]
MDSDLRYNPFHSEVRWLSPVKVVKRLYELRKEVSLFLIDKKSDLSQFFQDIEWIAMLDYLGGIFSYINELNLKLEGSDTTVFNAWNKVELFRKKLKLWRNMISEYNIKIFPSYSHCAMEDHDFSAQNSV